MRYPRARGYEDELGQERRVDRSALSIIAKFGEQHGRQLFLLDPERPAERIGNRRKRRS